MAAAAFLSRSRGAAVCWTAARGSIVVVILVPPFSSALKRALNDGRGSARSTRAIDRKGATSRGAGVGLDHRLRRILNRDFADRPPPSISNRVGRNPQQPGGERRPAILKAVQRRERFVKDLGGHVLGGGAVVNATHDERVDPFEM